MYLYSGYYSDVIPTGPDWPMSYEKILHEYIRGISGQLCNIIKDNFVILNYLHYVYLVDLYKFLLQGYMEYNGFGKRFKTSPHVEY